MPLVQITGNAWTHQGQPIGPERRPELFFAPKAHGFGDDSLLIGVEAKADLQASGYFTVMVEAAPGLLYQPRMRWLLNPAEQDPEQWAYGYAEWPFLIAPGNGGVIGDLIGVFPPGTILVGIGEPPIGGVVWIDITDETENGVAVWAPEGTF
ncbi:hypothetical protein P2P98_03235 [Microbacterium sp. Kw_RZR3]|uniref:hypothetical protein n=1 Tax=Microbacterium sp. Kw_RZR3 TaxID=3032903 RepID=UPI0023DBB23F|nr:hypothetical protein [Microbacterium sp. Kw_RZR3]MDF2045163.1 hypothetical protein [Microbacterium sp. Kw_RZR3]